MPLWHSYITFPISEARLPVCLNYPVKTLKGCTGFGDTGCLSRSPSSRNAAGNPGVVPFLSPIEPRASQKAMCSLESLLRRHEQIDRVACPSNSLPVPFGIGKYLRRLGEQVAARGHRYGGAALSAEWLVLLAGDHQDALSVSWGLGQQDVGAQVLSRGDDVLTVPPYLGKLLFKVDLVVSTEEGVGAGWLVG